MLNLKKIIVLIITLLFCTSVVFATDIDMNLTSGNVAANDVNNETTNEIAGNGTATNNIDTTNTVAGGSSNTVSNSNTLSGTNAETNANVQSVLVSHNIVECMDSQKPASISPKVHEILRDNLNFTGVIMTDDLAMEGIKKYTTDESAAVLAVKAGNDMIISSDFETQRKEVLKAVKQGRISEDIINMAVKRILACKYAYKIIT